MMKKIVLLGMLPIMFLGNVLAQVDQNRPTMHSIIFADTYDNKIGAGVEVSKQKFDWFLGTVANKINYEYDPIFYAGSDCSREKLESVLNEFKCDTADIVVFCYLGHGGRSNEDTSMFPQMCLHEKYQKNFVPLERVKNNLAKHGARLTWIIGDCCNSYSEYIKPKDVEAAGETMLPGAAVNLINQLFLQTTGVITMCASKPGTYGWCNSVTGMYFNNALIDAIESTNLNSTIPEEPWSSVMNVVMKELYTHTFYDTEDASHRPHKMEPRYRIESRKKGQHIDSKKPLPSTLQRDLSAIANSNIHPIERTRLIPQILRSHFEGDGIVRTVSKDGLPYGSIYTFRNYLGRVARSEKIVNIVVRNVKTSPSGKITYMEVHEIYSE